MNLNLSSYVILRTDFNDLHNTFLVDTGADISIIKTSKLAPGALIDKNFTTNISGIGESVVRSIGTIRTGLIIENIILEHTFHIVDDSFNVPSDGILGLDFIRKYNCILDYRKNNNMLVLRPNNFKGNVLVSIYDTPRPNSLSIPARSQVVRKIDINGTGDVLIPNQQLNDGIFVANTIVTARSSYVRIINTTNKNVLLDNLNIITENLSDYSIFQVKDGIGERSEKVLQRLSKHFPAFVQKPLTELCTEFSDIFALETEKITTNNFYKQKLRLTDNDGVYIKNYRIPYNQKDEIRKQIEKLRNDDIIEPSTSPYNSPILLVPKKSLPGSKEKR